MRISVGIPTFHRPAMLREAIASALTQTPSPYEIIVGDDANDPQIEATCHELSQHSGVKIWHLRNDGHERGQSQNVARIINHASGDIFSLLHDDDRYRCDAFQHLLTPFRTIPTVIASYGKQIIITEQGHEDILASEQLNRRYGRTPEKAGIQSSNRESAMLQMFPNDAYFVRMSAAKQIDYHANGIASKACDFYFGLRLARSFGTFYFCDEYTSDYRLTKVSSARSGTNSGFYCMKLLLRDLTPADLTPAIRAHLQHKVKVAIIQGATLDKALAWKFFFSEHHRCNIFSPGGARRLLKLLIG